VADDWYQRRRQDTEGEFFRKVADQGPRKGEGGGTRQGIYCLTADGTLLSYKNAGQSAEVTKEYLEAGLAKWQKLPSQRRQPGAVKILKQPRTDAQYQRSPPKGTQVFQVFTRILNKTSESWEPGTCGQPYGDQPARDHLWILADELAAMNPKEVSEGMEIDVPSMLVTRLARFHLLDNTRGEPPSWNAEEVKRARIKLRATNVDPKTIHWRVTGEALMQTVGTANKNERGFEARIGGTLTINRQSGRIDAMTVVAVGDHWGEATFTRGARTGKAPLGVLIETPKDERVAAEVPPQFARDLPIYLRMRY
jgi:hypothetical protein